MHEYSILDALLAQIDVEAARVGARAVHRIELRVGEQSGVDPGLLWSAWELLGRRGITEEATLAIIPEAVAWACRRCGAEIAIGGPLSCAKCRSPARLIRGDAIMLERLELEVPDV